MTSLEMTCPRCGSKFTVRCPALLKLRKFCSKKCAGQNIRQIQGSRPPSEQPAWKGGKSRSREYVLIRTDPSKPGASAYELEHRLVMQKHIGRELLPGEVVHHINGIKTDNRIENLLVIGLSEHTLLHAISNGKHELLPKTCDECGGVFKPNNNRRRFCSQPCYRNSKK